MGYSNSLGKGLIVYVRLNALGSKSVRRISSGSRPLDSVRIQACVNNDFVSKHNFYFPFPLNGCIWTLWFLFVVVLNYLCSVLSLFTYMLGYQVMLNVVLREWCWCWMFSYVRRYTGDWVSEIRGHSLGKLVISDVKNNRTDHRYVRIWRKLYNMIST